MSSEKIIPTVEPVLKANQFFYGQGEEKALVTVSRSYKDELESWTYQRLGGKEATSTVIKDINIALYNDVQAEALKFVAIAAKREKEQREKADAERKAKEEAERKAFEDRIKGAASDLFKVGAFSVSSYRKEITFYADSSKKDGVSIEEEIQYPSHGRYYISRGTETGKVVYVISRGYRERSRFSKLPNAISKIRVLLKSEVAKHEKDTSELEAYTAFAKAAGMKLYKGSKSYGSGRDMKYYDEFKLLMLNAENDYHSDIIISLSNSSTADGKVQVHGYYVEIKKPLRWMGKFVATSLELHVELKTADDVKHFVDDVVKSFLPEIKKTGS